jgi:2,5-diketo-D-gluconate reductase A
MARREIELNAEGPPAQGREGLFDNETIAGIAETKVTTATQALLPCHLQQGVVAFPKSSNSERLAANLEVFDFELTDPEVEAIDALDEDKYLMKSPIGPRLVR